MVVACETNASAPSQMAKDKMARNRKYLNPISIIAKVGEIYSIADLNAIENNLTGIVSKELGQE